MSLLDYSKLPYLPPKYTSTCTVIANWYCGNFHISHQFNQNRKGHHIKFSVMEVIPTALHKFVKVTVFFKKNKNKFRTKVYNKMIRPFNLE